VITTLKSETIYSNTIAFITSKTVCLLLLFVVVVVVVVVVFVIVVVVWLVLLTFLEFGICSDCEGDCYRRDSEPEI
jgi:hypothetical protein